MRSRQRVLVALALLAPAGGLATLAAARPQLPARAAARLSLAQLAGQRVILGFAGTRPPAALVRRIARGEAAGVILFTRNIASRAQLRVLTRRLQAIRRPPGLRAPLLVMIDQEGGLVKRLSGPPAESPAQLGRSGSSTRASRAGVATGRSLRGVGVNVDLAPVLDLGRPGGVMRRLGRSYAASPSTAGRIGTAFARGLSRGGAIPTAKHFPGLGSARTDEDRAVNRIDSSARLLRAQDERPFAAAARGRVPMVMVSTALYPALDRVPALFSRAIATGELRGRAGFRGVSITDDLEVPAIARVGPPGRLAVRSARAGIDLLLFAQSYGAAASASDALVRAMESGAVSRRASEVAVGRVLALRARAAG